MISRQNNDTHLVLLSHNRTSSFLCDWTMNWCHLISTIVRIGDSFNDLLNHIFNHESVYEIRRLTTLTVPAFLFSNCGWTDDA
jgi:hypothetical protein